MTESTDGFRYHEPHYNADLQRWVIHTELGVYFDLTPEAVLAQALAAYQQLIARR